MRSVRCAKNKTIVKTKYEKFWSPAFDVMDEFVLLIDADCNLIKVNKSFAAFIGKSERDLVGKKCYWVIHGTQEPFGRCPHQKTLKTQKFESEELYDSRFRKWLYIRTAPLFDHQHKLIGVVHLITDITKRKLAEEKFRKTKEKLEVQTWGLKKTNEAVRLLYKELEEKNKKLKELDQLKSDFISTVSHELRTPLTSISGGVSLVLEEKVGEINRKQQRFLSITQRNIDRLTRLINNLLDISRIEAGRMKVERQLVDMISLVHDVLETFRSQARKKGITLEAQCPSNSCKVYADPDKITQVLTNLINNALKFTDKKGKVTISGKDKGEYLQISVADTGRGIPLDKLEVVFDKFQQIGRLRGPGLAGTGLGLPICKGIIEAHGGKIWAESRGEGKGSKFIFTLPKGLRKEDLRKEGRRTKDERRKTKGKGRKKTEDRS